MNRDAELQAAADMLDRSLDLDAQIQDAMELRDCYARLCAAAVLGQRPWDAEDWAERYLTAAAEVSRLIDMQAGAE